MHSSSVGCGAAVIRRLTASETWMTWPSRSGANESSVSSSRSLADAAVSAKCSVSPRPARLAHAKASRKRATSPRCVAVSARGQCARGWWGRGEEHARVPAEVHADDAPVAVADGKVDGLGRGCRAVAAVDGQNQPRLHGAGVRGDGAQDGRDVGLLRQAGGGVVSRRRPQLEVDDAVGLEVAQDRGRAQRHRVRVAAELVDVLREQRELRARVSTPRGAAARRGGRKRSPARRSPRPPVSLPADPPARARRRQRLACARARSREDIRAGCCPSDVRAAPGSRPPSAPGTARGGRRAHDFGESFAEVLQLGHGVSSLPPTGLRSIYVLCIRESERASNG